MSDRLLRIEERLQEAFVGAEILIRDQSHLHVGHDGAKDGRGHYAVTVISDRFAGANRIQRHKMVYDALGDLLESDIHAIRIKALATSEQ